MDGEFVAMQDQIERSHCTGFLVTREEGQIRLSRIGSDRTITWEKLLISSP
jgi:hypothetical protein